MKMDDSSNDELIHNVRSEDEEKVNESKNSNVDNAWCKQTMLHVIAYI